MYFNWILVSQLFKDDENDVNTKQVLKYSIKLEIGYYFQFFVCLINFDPNHTEKIIKYTLI